MYSHRGILHIRSAFINSSSLEGFLVEGSPGMLGYLFRQGKQDLLPSLLTHFDC